MAFQKQRVTVYPGTARKPATVDLSDMATEASVEDDMLAERAHHAGWASTLSVEEPGRFTLVVTKETGTVHVYNWTPA